MPGISVRSGNPMAIGIILGSGAQFFFQDRGWRQVDTPYGPACLTQITRQARNIILVRRHGLHLSTPPHLVDCRAHITALKEAGATRVLATAAVGSTRTDLAPGTLAVLGDFIDFTKRRASTMFDSPCDSPVHTDFSTPYCPVVSSALETAAHDLGIPMPGRVTYLCVDGPRYETPAETRMFAHWGADVVGMTGVPEVVLAREAGICYGALAIVTNFASGVGKEPPSHEHVLKCLSAHSTQIQALLDRAVELIPDEPACCV